MHCRISSKTSKVLLFGISADFFQIFFFKIPLKTPGISPDFFQAMVPFPFSKNLGGIYDPSSLKSYGFFSCVVPGNHPGAP